VPTAGKEPGRFDSLRRFSDRVQDYVRYRPSYPAAALGWLRERGGLGPGTPVADVGAGTGIFSRLLLEAGARVFAVEPNDAMRAAAEAQLGGNAAFLSSAGTAEATGLPAGGVALVTCAQAFHWFEPARARAEFRRILAPGGACALLWNTSVRGGAFAEGYEEIKARFGTDFKEIRHEELEAGGRMAAFYGPAGYEKRLFPNAQALDRDGLRGRLLSSSYAPKAGHPNHAPMLAALDALFARCQAGGRVAMEYQTEVYLGRFSS